VTCCAIAGPTHDRAGQHQWIKDGVAPDDKRSRSDLISEYLTWDELIHTAYFKVPLFNKLPAYSITRSEGSGRARPFLQILTTTVLLPGMLNSLLTSVQEPKKYLLKCAWA
jgi:hypothetical protein